MRKINDFRLWSGFDVDNLVLDVFNAHEFLEPVHEVWISTDISSGSFHENALVDQIRRIQIADLEELRERLLIANKFLDTVKESEFVLRWSQGE